MQTFCTLLQTHNHTNSSSLNFFTSQMLFLTTNQQCQSTEGIASKDYLLHKLTKIWLPPFCKQNLFLFIQPKGSLEHISLIAITFCFNEFAFTIQVKHKINSTQILGSILISLYFTTGHFHTCILCKEYQTTV